MTNESHQSTSGQPTISRRGLLVGTTALGLAAAHAVTTAGAGPAAAAPGEPLGPINYDSAALTGAARGAAYLDGAVYIASRHNVAEGTIRLAAFDPFTGEAVSVHDLDIGARSGNNVLTADDRYVYIGAAGNASVWRFDPSTGTAEPFAPIGTASTWTYRLRVDGDDLWIGTYPTGALFRADRATGAVEEFGQVGRSQYTTAIAADPDYVYAGTAAPGDLRAYARDGSVAYELTPFLEDSPVGILDVAASNGFVYVSCGRFLISMRPDGSERIVRDIPADDRYIDQLTVTPDGRVLALARLTTNYYEITDAGFDLLGTPWHDAENAGFFAVDDTTVVGATGLGHVWSSTIGGEAIVTETASRGFGYPESVQSMLAHRNGTVWAAGHFAMTVHHPKRRNNGAGHGNQQPSRVPPDRFDIGGEPKSMAQTRSGTVVAGLYPSTRIVAIHPHTYEIRDFGPIDNDQMRPLAMAYDSVRDQVLVATTAKQRLHTGALTFVDPRTGEMEVRRDLLPNQNLRNVVIAGDYAYVAGDTFAEASEERELLVASIAEIDLRTRTVSRVFQPREWDSYEDIHVTDGVLYAVGRRPNGAWFAFDLAAEEVVLEGDTGGYGGLGGLRGQVYCWNVFDHNIQRLIAADGGSEHIVYDDVPNGWYNRPELAFGHNKRGAWGMYGTDLAWFPLRT
ncbi:hypothetical protein [Haloactinopolyspora sp.]|uniref:hypothetical protein n=1 Tax=Haloactinopolyspora sp. TaxID=1966353 RepID=UPI0026279566|nr:hypothetical protein [Haloactinopolyspora sp.]